MMKSIGEYIEEHSTRETEALEWIGKQTHIRTNHARMLTGAVQGRFLKMLVEATAPQRILEIGTFTGYSAVCLAMALPGDGHLDTLEQAEKGNSGGREQADVRPRVHRCEQKGIS